MYRYFQKCQSLFSYTPLPLFISSCLLSRIFPSNCTFLHTSAVYTYTAFFSSVNTIDPPPTSRAPPKVRCPFSVSHSTNRHNSLPPLLLHVSVQNLPLIYTYLALQPAVILLGCGHSNMEQRRRVTRQFNC